MHLCYNKYSSKGNTKGDGTMENKVYILWYRNTETHRTSIWGIYGTEEKAESNKRTAEDIGFICWINEEEVQ